MQPDEATQEGLRQQFRIIMLLLALVTDITHGHPTLGDRFADSYLPALDSARPKHVVAMNAVAALLVRNGEIVATAAHGLTPLPLSTHPPSNSMSCHLLATIQEPDLIEMDFEDVGFSFTGFTTVRNPDKKDKPFDGQYMLSTEGKSHWASVHANPWFGLTLPCVFFFSYLWSLFIHAPSGKPEKMTHFRTILPPFQTISEPTSRRRLLRTGLSSFTSSLATLFPAAGGRCAGGSTTGPHRVSSLFFPAYQTMTYESHVKN